jgi:hypothetical protein
MNCWVCMLWWVGGLWVGSVPTRGGGALVGELGGVARKRQKIHARPPGHTFPCVAAGSPQTVWCVRSRGHARFRCLESRSRGGRGEGGRGMCVGWCGRVGCLGSPRKQGTAPGRTRPPPRRGTRTSPEHSPIARWLHSALSESHICIDCGCQPGDLCCCCSLVCWWFHYHTLFIFRGDCCARQTGLVPQPNSAPWRREAHTATLAPASHSCVWRY